MKAITIIATALLFLLLAVLEAMAASADPWTTHLQQVTGALAKQDPGAAKRAWHEAYTAALASRRWEGMVEVGDALRRIGDASGSGKAVEGRARRLYLSALFRARQAGSLDGVLRAAEAFSALGDHEVVARCLRIAERLAADQRDTQARDRVLLLAERLGHRAN